MMNRDIDNGVFDRDWAKISGLSKYYFIRLFREKCGKTPHAYFCDLCMERAKFLLRQARLEHALPDDGCFCNLSACRI